MQGGRFGRLRGLTLPLTVPPSVHPMTTPSRPSTPLVEFDRLLIVHGFGATPQDHWFPWLASLHPNAERILLPDPLTPRADVWAPLVAEALERLGAGTAVVAHSLGNATTFQALRSLAERGRPLQLGAFAGVAPFTSPVPPTGDAELDAFLDTDHTDPLSTAPQHAFYEGLDLGALRPLLGQVRVLRSDDDPIVPSHLSDEVASSLGVQGQVVDGAGHFLAEDGMRELPQLLSMPTPR